MTNPAINAAAIATITTQTQMEGLPSFFSSIFITSFVAVEMPMLIPAPFSSASGAVAYHSLQTPVFRILRCEIERRDKNGHAEVITDTACQP
jgi:hypothetical protein